MQITDNKTAKVRSKVAVNTWRTGKKNLLIIVQLQGVSKNKSHLFNLLLLQCFFMRKSILILNI